MEHYEALYSSLFSPKPSSVQKKIGKYLEEENITLDVCMCILE